MESNKALSTATGIPVHTIDELLTKEEQNNVQLSLEKINQFKNDLCSINLVNKVSIIKLI